MVLAVVLAVGVGMYLRKNLAPIWYSLKARRALCFLFHVSTVTDLLDPVKSQPNCNASAVFLT